MTSTISTAAIPHRPPFLFVDDVVEVSEERIATTWFVNPTSDFFRGHYPDEPIMPGVLLCECCFQAGALLIAHRLGSDAAPSGMPVVARIADARFRRIVRPGETLRVEVTFDDAVDNAFYLTGRITVAGQIAARVSFTIMQTPDEAEAE